jgi:hypothetical protein
MQYTRRVGRQLIDRVAAQSQAVQFHVAGADVDLKVVDVDIFNIGAEQSRQKARHNAL